VIRVACSTIAFTGMPLGDAFARIRSLGFAHVDLSVHHAPGWGHFQAEDIRGNQDLVLEELLRAREASGVGVAAINLNLDPGFSAERGQFESACLFAVRAGAPVVSLVPSRRNEAVERHRLADHLAIATRYGVVLAVEFHDPSVMREMRSALDFARDMPGLRITLDTGHLIHVGTPQSEWGPLYPHVRHVHVKDAGRGLGLAQTPVGKGDLNVPLLVSDLKAAGYDGALSVEYIGRLAHDEMRFDPEPEMVRMREELEKAL
jgi:sugar phosphate isomerase/epimerase